MAAEFEMQVREKLVLAGIPDVIVAGPVIRGECRKGESLVLRGAGPDQQVTCNGIELLNWGAGRTGWISVRLSEVDLEDLAQVTSVLTVLLNSKPRKDPKSLADQLFLREVEIDGLAICQRRAA
jgi:translation elongation factor EF-Tu-like GTPase